MRDHRAKVSEKTVVHAVRSAPATRQSPWAYIAVTLAVLATVISLVAWYFSYRADVVEFGELSGTPELDAYRAQVEELQRANDRILNTAWAMLGIVATLAAVLVIFSFVRGDRVIDRERALIEERFQAAVQRRHETLQDRISSERSVREDFEDETRQDIDDLRWDKKQLGKRLREERRKRAELQFQLVQFQQDVMRLAQHSTSAEGPPLPFYYTRVYGPLPTAAGLLRAAWESERPSLVSQALRRLGNAAQGPIPNSDHSWLDEIIRDVEALPPAHNPLRDEVLVLLRGRLQERPPTQQEGDESSESRQSAPTS